MTCSHDRTSVGFYLDYSFERDGYLLDRCCECQAWRYINHPTDREWHRGKVPRIDHRKSLIVNDLGARPEESREIS